MTKKAFKSGQTAGAPVALADLNGNEQAVLVAAQANPGALTLGALAFASFPELAPEQASSWTRNALRRLVRSGFVQKLDAGTYAVARDLPRHIAAQAKADAETELARIEALRKDHAIRLEAARLALSIAKSIGEQLEVEHRKAWNALLAARKASR